MFWVRLGRSEEAGSGIATSVGKEACEEDGNFELGVQVSGWGGSALVPTEQVGSCPSPDPLLPQVAISSSLLSMPLGQPDPQLPRLLLPCPSQCVCVSGGLSPQPALRLAEGERQAARRNQRPCLILPAAREAADLHPTRRDLRLRHIEWLPKTNGCSLWP